MNRVILVGRLVKDPDLRFTLGKGTAVTRINLAVNRINNKSDKKEADFIPIVIWGKPAEAAASYMSKGSLMGVCGRIQTRSYEVNGTKRYVTEVIAEEVQFLSKGNTATSDSSVNADRQNVLNTFNFGEFDTELTPVNDGDIPF